MHCQLRWTVASMVVHDSKSIADAMVCATRARPTARCLCTMTLVWRILLDNNAPCGGRVKLGFHIYAVSVSGMHYALSGKNRKACKRTRVIPYVRIRDAICRAAANGCVCGKLNRSMGRTLVHRRYLPNSVGTHLQLSILRHIGVNEIVGQIMGPIVQIVIQAPHLARMFFGDYWSNLPEGPLENPRWRPFFSRWPPFSI